MPNRSAHFAGAKFPPKPAKQNDGSDDPETGLDNSGSAVRTPEEVTAILTEFAAVLDSLVGTKITQKTKCTYVIYQEEICPSTGARHLQFYFQCESEIEWKSVKKFWTKKGYPDLHFESAIKCSDTNRNYCAKSKSKAPNGLANELGQIKTIAGRKGQGSREDLKKLKSDIDDGMQWDELMNLHFGTIARHNNFIKEYMAYQSSQKFKTEMKEQMEAATLRTWQQGLLTKVSTAGSTRTVHWYWEGVGNVGKSWMAKYLSVVKDALVVTAMKKADLLYLIANARPSLVIFDLSRTTEDGSVQVVYEVLESLNNGHICSGKYQSQSFYMAPPHAVVFANYAPDQSKLSADRWKLNGESSIVFINDQATTV